VHFHHFQPVNVYVGGVEHAQMHMFYARFISHFLYSCLGLLPQPEPFARFIALGMVRSRAYRVLSSGKYVPPSEVDGDPSEFFLAISLEILIPTF
jgi:leucyl-tRNA synthetase